MRFQIGSLWKLHEDAVGGEKFLLIIERIELSPPIFGQEVCYLCLTSSGRVTSLQSNFMFPNYYQELRP